MKRIWKKIFLAGCCSLCFTVIFGGWVIKEESYNNFSTQRSFQTIVIQDHFIKIIEEEATFIYNTSSGLLTIVDFDSEEYWMSHINDFRKQIVDILENGMKEVLHNIPDERKNDYSDLYESLYFNNTEKGENKRKTELKVKKLDKAEKISGYKTDHFQIWIQGTLKSDVWIAESVNIPDEFELKKLYMLLSDIVFSFDYSGYTHSRVFQSLIREGYPVKTIDYENGFKTIKVVTDIHKEKIKDTAFKPPGDYQLVELTRILFE